MDKRDRNTTSYTSSKDPELSISGEGLKSVQLKTKDRDKVHQLTRASATVTEAISTSPRAVPRRFPTCTGCANSTQVYTRFKLLTMPKGTKASHL